MGWKKDFFTPKNPSKYLGDVNNIIYRSSWEHYAFDFCDNNINVLRWSSEEIKIPYMKPKIDGSGQFTKSVYYPDIYMEYIDANGELQKYLVEIKPEKQTKPSRSIKYRDHENYTYLVNQLKWEAAEHFCKTNGIEFMILTEKGLYRQAPLKS